MQSITVILFFTICGWMQIVNSQFDNSPVTYSSSISSFPLSNYYREEEQPDDSILVKRILRIIMYNDDDSGIANDEKQDGQEYPQIGFSKIKPEDVKYDKENHKVPDSMEEIAEKVLSATAYNAHTQIIPIYPFSTSEESSSFSYSFWNRLFEDMFDIDSRFSSDGITKESTSSSSEKTNSKKIISDAGSTESKDCFIDASSSSLEKPMSSTESLSIKSEAIDVKENENRNEQMNKSDTKDDDETKNDKVLNGSHSDKITEFVSLDRDDQNKDHLRYWMYIPLAGSNNLGSVQGNNNEPVKVSIEIKKDSIEAKKDSIETKKDSIEAKKDSIEAKKDSIEAKKDSIETKKDSIEAKKDSIETTKEQTDERSESNAEPQTEMKLISEMQNNQNHITEKDTKEHENSTKKSKDRPLISIGNFLRSLIGMM